MNGKELAAALHSGRRVWGTCVVSTSPHWPIFVQELGLDFVFLDTEHIANDRLQLSWMCQAYRAMNVAPIVRIPEPDPFLACMALDGGATGIIAPYVETVEQLQTLRGAVKLRPLKGRRLREALADESTLEPSLREYLEGRNADNVLIANIESVPAVEALDSLVAVPGLDAVLIGPHDLSTSLGVPEQYDHPRFDEAVRTIITAARRRNVGAGIHFWASIEQEIAWGRSGANLMLHSNDLLAFRTSMEADLDQLRSALNDT